MILFRSAVDAIINTQLGKLCSSRKLKVRLFTEWLPTSLWNIEINIFICQCKRALLLYLPNSCVNLWKDMNSKICDSISTEGVQENCFFLGGGGIIGLFLDLGRSPLPPWIRHCFEQIIDIDKRSGFVHNWQKKSS